MPINDINQPDLILISKLLRLRKPKSDEFYKGFDWYQNKEVMLNSEGITDRFYSKDEIEKIYSYLSKTGELYFIEILEDEWISIGDVTLSLINMPIVIGYKKYWGRGIGKKVISNLIERSKELGFKQLKVPKIFHYNKRSKTLFTSLGFVEVENHSTYKSYELNL